jgi:opacity protein-like surface antigen
VNQNLTTFDPALEQALEVNSDYGIFFKRQNTWGFNLRLGHHLTHHVSVFAKLGVLSTKFNLQYQDYTTAGAPSKNQNKTLLGLEPGVGIEAHLHKNLFLRLEYGYQIYKTFKTNNLQPALHSQTDYTKLKVTPRYHVGRVGVAYRFNFY